MIITLEDIAGYLMFGTVKTGEELEEKIKGHWQFRKNKDLNDVNKAVEKGLKIGRGKTEMEIDGVALYLKDVFKEVRSSKKIV